VIKVFSKSSSQIFVFDAQIQAKSVKSASFIFAQTKFLFRTFNTFKYLPVMQIVAFITTFDQSIVRGTLVDMKSMPDGSLLTVIPRELTNSAEVLISKKSPYAVSLTDVDHHFRDYCGCGVFLIVHYLMASSSVESH
jgi:hypothetical protein